MVTTYQNVKNLNQSFNGVGNKFKTESLKVLDQSNYKNYYHLFFLLSICTYYTSIVIYYNKLELFKKN